MTLGLLLLCFCSRSHSHIPLCQFEAEETLVNDSAAAVMYFNTPETLEPHAFLSEIICTGSTCVSVNCVHETALALVYILLLTLQLHL